MNRKIVSRLLVAVLLLAAGGATVFAQSGGEYNLSWNTVDSGGGNSSGGSYNLSGTAGQPDAGNMSGGAYTLEGGFWGAAACAVPVPGLTATTGNGTITLTWSVSGGVPYDVYRSTTPYQMPGSAHATDVSSPWSDAVLGDPGTHHFYWVLGANCALSRQVGEYEFPLIPGA